MRLRFGAFVLLSFLHILALGLALLVYTSFIPGSPFYEPSGFQVITLFWLTPALTIIGGLQLILGIGLRLSKLSRLLPFLSASLLLLPLFLECISIGTVIIAGSLMLLGLAFTLLIVTKNEIFKVKRKVES
jgi:hypothetical protein